MNGRTRSPRSARVLVGVIVSAWLLRRFSFDGLTDLLKMGMCIYPASPLLNNWRDLFPWWTQRVCFSEAMWRVVKEQE